MSDGTSDLTPRQVARRRNPEVSARIGANIRRRRLALGMTQGELARVLDDWTAPNDISRWERGAHRPIERTLDRLAEVLEVDLAYFYSAHEDELETEAAA